LERNLQKLSQDIDVSCKVRVEIMCRSNYSICDKHVHNKCELHFGRRIYK